MWAGAEVRVQSGCAGAMKKHNAWGTCRCITPLSCCPPPPWPCRWHARHDQVRCASWGEVNATAACTCPFPARCLLRACLPGLACPTQPPLPCAHSLSIEVRGPSRDLHSGNEGGVFTEPLADLSKVGGGLVLQRGSAAGSNYPHAQTMLPAWRAMPLQVSSTALVLTSLLLISTPSPPLIRCWPAWWTATTTSWCPASMPTCGPTCCR